VSTAVALPCADHPRASVLIAAFGADRFEACLSSLAESLPAGPPVEVIAVLNGPEAELRAVAARASGLRVIDPPVNLGFPAGGNLARSAARGEYIVLVQDDGRVSPGWLGHLLDVADAHPEAGLVGSVTLRPGGERIMQAGQALFSDGSVVDVLAGRPPSVLDGRQPFAVDTLSSHGLLVRASTWDAVGGLEEAFFPLYMVDLSLSREVWTRGEAVVCAPQAHAEHTRNASTRRRFREFLFRRHHELWLDRWGAQIADQEPPGDRDEAAIERSLGRADRLWRTARPGPRAVGQSRPPYDLDGDERQRLEAAVRFALLDAEAREQFAVSLEQSLDELEGRVGELEAESARRGEEIARASAHIGHVEDELRSRMQRLSAIESSRWWRLGARLRSLGRS
jgi:GT2 family glycosyltransferase